MKRAAALTLLLLLLGCPSEPTPDATPPPAPTPNPPKETKPATWTIVYGVATDTDFGDGTLRASESVDTHVSRQGVYQIATSWSEKPGTKGKRPPPERTDLPPLSEERLSGIEKLLPAVQAVAEKGDPAFGLRYSLTQHVDDEGGSWEGLTVKIDDRLFSIALEQGRQSPYPPPEVVKLYELVSGGKAPPKWD